MNSRIKLACCLFLFGGASCCLFAQAAANLNRQKSSKEPVIAPLVGHSIYACASLDDALGEVHNWNKPAFYRVMTPDGNQIPEPGTSAYFESYEPLLIRSVSVSDTSKAGYQRTAPTEYIELEVLNKASNYSAMVEIPLDPENLAKGKILPAVIDGVYFRSLPARLRIGATEGELYCAVGYPDHTNHDELGGDQLVYSDQQMYVYLDPLTGRVANFQTTR